MGSKKVEKARRVDKVDKLSKLFRVSILLLPIYTYFQVT